MNAIPEPLAYTLGAFGVICALAIALWAIACFLEWIHDLVITWRSRSFDAGRESERFRMHEAADWFSSDLATKEMIHNLADGRDVSNTRSDYFRRRGKGGP